MVSVGPVQGRNPLNSENASPFGTRTVYLAWPLSCAETALPPKTASTRRDPFAVHRHFPRCLLVASYRKDLNAGPQGRQMLRELLRSGAARLLRSRRPHRLVV